MTAGKCPGGLTALAVLNFVFGGFGVLGVLGLAAILVFVDAQAAAEGGNVEMQGLVTAWRETGMGFLYINLLLSLLGTILMIASGVGYLQQKKFLGRTLGSAYALLSILQAVITGLLLPAEAVGGFGLASAVNLIYPILTLILLNTTFKEDFVR